MQPEKNVEVNEVQVLVEDLLKSLAHRGTMDREWDPFERLSKETQDRRGAVLENLVRNGFIEGVGRKWRLTERGRERAVELLRAHRLMETYLARKEGLPAGELHAAADRAEHYLTVEKANELADSMNRPRYDPHGDPIPERASDLHQVDQVPLLEMPVDAKILIAHIEDEPIADFQELERLGLSLELPLKILGKGEQGMDIEVAGERIQLSPNLVGHIEVCPLPEGDSYCEELRRLSSLKAGESGEVAFISSACMGPERRRLLDFGMVPGSKVTHEFSSPFGSPVAYSVRGTVVALRASQARNILIRKKS